VVVLVVVVVAAMMMMMMMMMMISEPIKKTEKHCNILSQMHSKTI
jgi:hypothetical protein